MKTLLEVKKLSVFYDDLVVDNVSLTLNSGDVVGLIGRNGCGKSTLLKGIMKTLKSSGQVFLKNEDFFAMKIRQRAKNVSMLTQRMDTVLGISVKELIALGNYALNVNRKINEKNVFQVAKLLQIDTLLDRDYTTLSEGQKQLVNLARILVQDTPVILLDEPDSALDFDNRHHLFKIVSNLVTNDKAALIVLHNPLFALNYCNRVLLMDKGKIICEIDLCKDSLEMINEKLQILYPQIIIKKENEQYYYLIKG